MTTTTRHITTGVLQVACEEHGAPDGWPVLLLHGFPYDLHASGRDRAAGQGRCSRDRAVPARLRTA